MNKQATIRYTALLALLALLGAPAQALGSAAC